MKNKYLAFNFKDFAILAGLLIGLWWFIFNCYPKLVKYYLILFEPGYISNNDILGKGTYGDMYGALNTYFSGLAFLGLLITIFLQIFIHDREILIEKEKQLRASKERVRFIKEISEEVLKNNDNFIENANDFLSTFKEDGVSGCYFNTVVVPSIYVFVREKIDAELYFSAYRELSQDDSITELLLIFSGCHFCMENFFEQFKKYDNTAIALELEHSHAQTKVFRVLSENGILHDEFLRAANAKTNEEMYLISKEWNKYFQDDIESKNNFENFQSLNKTIRENKRNLIDAFETTIGFFNDSRPKINNNITKLTKVLG